MIKVLHFLIIILPEYFVEPENQGEKVKQAYHE
jgi:hypothetical protein